MSKLNRVVVVIASAFLGYMTVTNMSAPFLPEMYGGSFWGLCYALGLIYLSDIWKPWSKDLTIEENFRRDIGME
jgi:hypothetical protein